MTPQVCSIQMSVDLDTVELLPGQETMEQPVDMTLFRITHYDLVYKNNLIKGEGIKMNIYTRNRCLRCIQPASELDA